MTRQKYIAGGEVQNIFFYIIDHLSKLIYSSCVNFPLLARQFLVLWNVSFHFLSSEGRNHN